MIILTSIFLFAFGDSAIGVALSALFGLIGTYLTQFVKKVTSAGGNSALLLTIAICVGLGFLSSFFIGGMSFYYILANSAIVFSLATIAYRFLLSKDAVITPTPPTV